MPKVHKHIARTDIYEIGKQVPDATTKSKFRLDRSQPANERDKVIVAKGEEYYKWSFRYGGVHISKTHPKPSQLTQSAYLQTIYGIEEEIGAASFSDASDLESFRDDIKSRLEELRDEQESKREAMPEQLQDSETGTLLQERYDRLDDAINELDNIDLDYDEPDEDTLRDELEQDDPEGGVTDDDIEELRAEKLREWIDERIEEIQQISLE